MRPPPSATFPYESLLRCFLLPLLPTALTLLLTLYWSPSSFDHPYPYTLLMFLVSLTQTIRVRFAYDRYTFHARSLEAGSAKMKDAVQMFEAFSTSDEANEEMWRRTVVFVGEDDGRRHVCARREGAKDGPDVFFHRENIL